MNIMQRWFEKNAQQSVNAGALKLTSMVNTRTSGIKNATRVIKGGENLFVVGESEVGGGNYTGRRNEHI